MSALRLLAESRSQSSRSQSLESQGQGDPEGNRVGGVADVSSEVKLCPMCEAQFPMGSEDHFEQHVMDHFSYDSDPETLQYYPPSDNEAEIQTDHL